MKIDSMLSAAVITFLFAHSSSVYSQQSIKDQERAAAGSEPVVVVQEAATVNKIETPSVAKAPEIIFNHKDRDILERLKKARDSGDRTTFRALISELDAMHGIAPAVETAAADIPEQPGEQLQMMPAITPEEFKGDIRHMPDAPEPAPGAEPRIVPEGQMPDGSGDGWNRDAPTQPASEADEPDQALQSEGSELPDTLTDGLNFAGQGYTNVAPPDTVGDVGANYYIQMTNHGSGSTFTIYNKSSGSVASSAKVLSTLASSGDCTSGLGDPIVVYDDLAGRWLLSEFSSTGDKLCVYVSKSGNPITGGWWHYQFQANAFPDYPKYGVWPNGYYVTTYEGSLLGIYVLERSKMLLGQPARLLYAHTSSLTPQTGVRSTRWLPADADGDTGPPGGAAARHYLFRSVEASQDTSNPTDRLEVWRVDIDWGVPDGTFGLLDIITDSFVLFPCSPGIRDCIPQPGTTAKLDALANRPLHRLQYRNFGSREALVTNQVVNTSGRAGVRWWELNRTGGAWSVRQKSTFSPDSTHRWMGSIAMDRVGNMALGYSVSSSSVYPGIRYTGREEGRDVLNTMQSESTLIGGSGAQTWTQRWGDYSSMNVDPVDDCTFWYTNEYMPASGLWATRIGSFSFDSCDEKKFPYYMLIMGAGTSSP